MTALLDLVCDRFADDERTIAWRRYSADAQRIAKAAVDAAEHLFDEAPFWGEMEQAEAMLCGLVDEPLGGPALIGALESILKHLRDGKEHANHAARALVRDRQQHPAAARPVRARRRGLPPRR